MKKPVLFRLLTAALLLCIVFAASSVFPLRAEAAAYSLASPNITELKNTSGGVTLTWSAVSGAPKYAVYRKVEGGGWVKKYVGTDTSFTDTAVCSGTVYYYKVRCMDEDGTTLLSPNPEGEKILYLKAPAVSSVRSDEGGIRVGVSTVKGAEAYRIYRKTGSSGTLKLIATVETVPYVDRAVTVGTSYAYAVRAVNDTRNTQSVLSAASAKVTYLISPPVTAKVQTRSVKLTWDPVPGAVKYAVLRKTSSGSWTTKTRTVSTSFVDSGVSSGSSYQYKVRCIDASGKTYLSANPTVTTGVTYMRAPQISSLTSVAEGVQVKWSGVTGADSYLIYRRVGTGSWVKKATLSGTARTYVDTTAKSGTTYSYTIRAVAANGAKSARFTTTAPAVTYLEAPAMVGLENTSDGIRIEWTAPEGSEYFRIFRKYGDDGAWTAKDVVRGTSFVDEAVISGAFYHYSVRCVSPDGSENLSARDETGLRILFLRQPALQAARNVHGGVLVEFSTPNGASGYEILRDDGSGFRTVGFSTEGEYLDRTTAFGETYVYTVRAFSIEGTMSRSTFDPEGLTILAEDISYPAYVAKPYIFLHEACGDDITKWMVLYNEPLQYLETTREYDSGSWVMVRYDDRIGYFWQPAGEQALTREPSSLAYSAEDPVRQEVLELAMEMYRDWPIAYRHGESNGVMAPSGTYGYDCSGFASFVLKQVMQRHIPTYWVTADITNLYGTETICNHGFDTPMQAVTISPEELLPGDLLFFDLSDESEFDGPEDGPVTHCGIYLGNNEFIHCTHFDSFGKTGLFLAPFTGRYLECFVSARRYLPDEYVPANQTMYAGSYVRVRQRMDAEEEPIDILDPETPVTILYTGSAQFTDDPNWAYVSYGDGQLGCVLLQYLMDSIPEISETMYVASTSIRLHTEPDLESDYTDILIGQEVLYCGRYGNTGYVKILLDGDLYYLYCPTGEKLRTFLTDDLDALMQGIGNRVLLRDSYLRSSMDSGDSSNIIQLLEEDDVVRLIAVSSSGTWSYVRTFRGHCGFVISANLGER